VSARRRSSTPTLKATANDAPPPKSIELEHRIGRLETKLDRVSEELELTRQQLRALQAHLDHLLAKLSIF
jgi:hypothetical protein